MFLLMLSNGHNNCKLLPVQTKTRTIARIWKLNLKQTRSVASREMSNRSKQFHYPGEEKRNLFYGFLVKRFVSSLSLPRHFANSLCLFLADFCSVYFDLCCENLAFTTRIRLFLYPQTQTHTHTHQRVVSAKCLRTFNGISVLDTNPSNGQMHRPCVPTVIHSNGRYMVGMYIPYTHLPYILYLSWSKCL